MLAETVGLENLCWKTGILQRNSNKQKGFWAEYVNMEEIVHLLIIFKLLIYSYSYFSQKSTIPCILIYIGKQSCGFIFLLPTAETPSLLFSNQLSNLYIDSTNSFKKYLWYAYYKRGKLLEKWVYNFEQNIWFKQTEGHCEVPALGQILVYSRTW